MQPNEEDDRPAATALATAAEVREGPQRRLGHLQGDQALHARLRSLLVEQSGLTPTLADIGALYSSARGKDVQVSQLTTEHDQLKPAAHRFDSIRVKVAERK